MVERIQHNGVATAGVVDDDDDDPIVEEIPVYLSKRMHKQLYIFQYPLLPKGTARVNIEKARFKPLNKVVKLDVSIDAQSSNFDQIRAEDLAKLIQTAEKDAKDVKSKRKKEEALAWDPSNVFNKIIYKSSKVLNNLDNYAVGVYNGREFHLTPLEGYIQLRPCLKFIDTCMRSKKNEVEEVDADEPASRARAVTVKFGKAEGDADLWGKEITYKQLMERLESEKWQECKWRTNRYKDFEYLVHKLFCENMEETGQLSMISRSEYMKLLVPEDQKQAVIKPDLPSHIVSLHSLRSLPVKEQCRLLLKDTKMIQFQQLMLLLASGQGVTHEAVIKSLPQVAVLVRGNWVAKSEVLYPQNSFSAISGVSAELMCKARDYVLYQFTRHDYVERRKVSQIIRLPVEEVKEIFTGVARLRHNKGWQLLLPEDAEFVAKHADIAERQKRLWEQRWQQLNDYYKGCAKPESKRKKNRTLSGGGGSSEHEPSTPPQSTERKRKKSTSAAGDAHDGEVRIKQEQLSPPKHTPRRKSASTSDDHDHGEVRVKTEVMSP